MRASSWSRWRFVLGTASVAAFLFLPVAAMGQPFLGLDFNNDGDCDPNGDFDMGRYYTAGEVGVDQTFEVIMGSGTPNFWGYGCVFCTRDSTHLESSYTWTYTSLSGWSDTPVYDSADPDFPIALSSYITSHTDWKYKCWIISSFDFSFTTPATTFPFSVGTFTFRPASEGPISWIFDVGDSHCAILTTAGVASVSFTAGQTCTPPAGTRETSWGSVKSLFR